MELNTVGMHFALMCLEQNIFTILKNALKTNDPRAENAKEHG